MAIYLDLSSCMSSHPRVPVYMSTKECHTRSCPESPREIDLPCIKTDVNPHGLTFDEYIADIPVFVVFVLPKYCWRGESLD
jgi:hypothetical protein